MSKTAEQVWQEYMQSIREKNDHWLGLLADNVEFMGPVMQAKGKENFAKMSQEFFQMVRGFDLIRYASSEKTVATEVKITVATPKDGELSMDVAEFFDIDSGKIKSIKIFYDAQEFRQEFGM